jgi:glycosyltransferase Alg8
MNINKVQAPLLDTFYLSAYIIFLLLLWEHLPKSIAVYYEYRVALISFGVIGIWRYSWWMNHVIRSTIYGRIIFPRRRVKANQLWDSGWRPKRLLFMMTTYKELPSTTELVLKSIVSECKLINVPIKLFIGIGDATDEVIINDFFKNHPSNGQFQVILVYQKLPGKRYAIGETLREMVRQGFEDDDPIIFMDGDTYFEPGCLSLCLPFFPLYPKMQALTTYEKSIVKVGPIWIQKWLDMRFAQRDFTMQSYALSNKILTLTGRMSIFRGKHLREPEFLEIIENDHITHWLWGTYRFLSGDDKSTWYYLLKNQADMFYIPDATTVTIEHVRTNPVDRMKENLRRWSGNTLRNGARAIALGPRTVGYFIWWCLIDQRCAIWTMLLGHMIVIVLACTQNIAFLITALLWIACSRLCIAGMLFLHARKVDMCFPFIIYINQLLSTVIKIHILFRLPQQRWKNRGDQSAGFETQLNWRLRGWIASYLTVFYCLSCMVLILILLQLVAFPTLGDVKVLLIN